MLPPESHNPSLKSEQDDGDREESEQIKTIGQRYALYQLQKKKIDEQQNCIFQRLRSSMYRGASCVWQTAIPSFMREFPKQFTFFSKSISSIKMSKNEKSKALQMKNLLKIFENQSIQEIFKKDSYALVLFYDRDSLSEIFQALMQGHLQKIIENYGKINLLEMGVQRNQYETQKMMQLKNQIKCKEERESNKTAEATFEDMLSINCFRQIKSRRVSLETTIDKENISPTLPQNEIINKSQMKDEKGHLQQQQIQNTEKMIFEYSNSSQDEKQNGIIVFPLLGIVWKGLFDQLIFLDWIRLPITQENTQKSKEKIQLKIEQQEQKELKIMKYIERRNKLKQNKKSHQTQKSLLETVQK